MPEGLSAGMVGSMLGAQRKSYFEHARSGFPASKELRRVSEVEDESELWTSPVTMLNGMMCVCEAGDRRSGKNSGRKGAAVDDPVEEWKESLRTLVRLQEATRNGGAGLEAPKVSSRSQGGRGDPRRTSSFDYKEVMRLSQRPLEVHPRRSLDESSLPRFVVDLRDAIQVRRDAVDEDSDRAVTPTVAHRPASRAPSVVARLMGLDDLPIPRPAAPPAPNKRINNEAKLLQQLLQYKPPPPSPPSEEALDGRYRPTTATRQSPVIVPQDEALPTGGGEGRVFPDYETRRPEQTQLHAALKRLESSQFTPERQQRDIYQAPTSIGRERKESGVPAANFVDQGVHDLKSSFSSKKRIPESVPGVVLRKPQSQESFKPRPYHGFEEEIERRLRQLGLQSSQQDRKTLKQILDAMQLKGLLRRAHVNSVDMNSEQQLDSVMKNVTRTLAPQLVAELSGAPPTVVARSKSRPPPPAMQGVRPSSKNGAEKQLEASIVIMKPLSKSSGGTSAAHHRHDNATKPTATDATNLTSNTHAISKSRTGLPNRPMYGKQNEPKVKGHLVTIESRKKETEGQDERPQRPQSTPQPVNKDRNVKINSRRPRENRGLRESSVAFTGHNTCTGKSSRVSDLARRSGHSANPKPDLPCAVELSTNEPSHGSELRPSDRDSDLANFESLHHVLLSSDCFGLPISKEDVPPPIACESKAVVNRRGDQSSISDNNGAIARGGNVCTYDENDRCCDRTKENLADVRTPPRARCPDDAAMRLDNPGKADSNVAESGDQSSPVSVLDAQLCDMEPDVSPVILKTHHVTSSENETEATQLEVSCVIPNLQRRLAECNVETNCLWESSRESRYALQIFEATGYSAEIDEFPARWLAGGCEIRPELFAELEQEWDATEDEHLPASDRDFGCELYMKSRQAAMRRRLVFDCLNQLLAGRLAWVNRPETLQLAEVGRCGNTQAGYSCLWNDLKRLESRPAVKANNTASADDTLHEMLEQDLMHNVDYTDLWQDRASYSASVARDLEGAIVDTIVDELLAELSCFS